MQNPFNYNLDNPKQTGDLWLNSFTCGVSGGEAPRQSLVSKSVQGQSANSEVLLLSQELEHGREVLLRVALCTHHPIDLMGLAAQENRALCVSGGVLCQSQILNQTRAGETRWDGEEGSFWTVAPQGFSFKEEKVYRKYYGKLHVYVHFKSAFAYKLLQNCSSQKLCLLFPPPTHTAPAPPCPTPPPSTRPVCVTLHNGEITQANVFSGSAEACMPKPNPIVELLDIHSISYSTNI